MAGDDLFKYDAQAVHRSKDLDSVMEVAAPKVSQRAIQQ
jgi:hypothetical protein